MSTTSISPDLAPTTTRGSRIRALVGTPGAKIALSVVGFMVVALAIVYLFGGKDVALVNQSVVTGLLVGGIYALVSMGLTLIFGVLGIVNFAQGAMLTMSMFLVYYLVSAAGLNVYIAAVLAIPIMFGFGWLVQSVLMNRLSGDVGHERPLMVTLGLSLLIINTLLMIFGGRPLAVGSPLDGSMNLWGTLVNIPRLIAFGGALLVAALLSIIIKKTPLGLAIRAVASNGTGAALVGVNVQRIFAMTFALGAASVGVAGGLMVPFTSLVPSVGDQYTTLAFVIVVLGGLGSIPGALLGGLLIGLLQTVGSLFLPGSGSLLMVFVVFVLILFLRPQGLFGAKQ